MRQLILKVFTVVKINKKTIMEKHNYEKKVEENVFTKEHCNILIVLMYKSR
jgi:hypothetical protein